MNSVRQPAVAGSFYSGNALELERDVRQFLHHADDHTKLLQHRPKALIVPHAGYIYSGATAASAYLQLQAHAKTIKRVVLLGPAHRVAVNGMAIIDVQYFRTPLGDVALDRHSNQQLLTLPQLHYVDAAHWQEHSLEVQLPFLQIVLEEFSLIPVLIGNATASDVEELLNMLWGGEETLILISSDLSHFHDYPTAQSIDRSTCEAIEHFDISHIGHQQACGSIGIKGLLRAAKRRQMSVQTIELCNSGDTAGDHRRVVGYGSWAFSELSPPNNQPSNNHDQNVLRH